MRTFTSYSEMRRFAYMNRGRQILTVSSAVNKLMMMGLTPANGMVECPPQLDIDPSRWKAMVSHVFNNGELK